MECCRCGEEITEGYYELDDNGSPMCPQHALEDIQAEFAEQYHDE
jgi:hypothetical protein